MAVDSRHPAYASRIEDWAMLRTAYEGETAVKAAGEKYLPPTTAHVLDGMRTPRSPGSRTT